MAFFVCRGGVVGSRRSLFFHHTLSEAKDGNLGTVEALLGAKADVNLQDKNSKTALLRAVKNWKTECRKNDSIVFVPCFTLILFHHPQPISWYPVLLPLPSSLIPRCVSDAALDTFFVVLPVFTSWKVARYPGR